ncbi:MAG: anti-sigma factor [Lewinella sp.]|nr:anti-sigma factor [Lewinella sp.]
MQQRYDELEQNCSSQDSVRLILAQQLNIYRDPAFQPVALTGTPLAPTAAATVLQNSAAKTVYFAANNLPAPPAGKQYQLWALVDGAPVDMGVLALTLNADELTAVPYIENAGAYAITLEDLGGHPSPNLDQLYVIGTL